MKRQQLDELLLQSLEHEKGGVKIYETALKCAVSKQLQEEWKNYLDQTRNHVTVLTQLCEKLGVKTEQDAPGQRIVRHLGSALVQAMEMALKEGQRDAAQLVACECVVLAETKDHMDWDLIGQCAEETEGDEHEALKQAYEQIEDQEDMHLYHTRGWCRELWIDSLGMSAVLPPPEEVKHVKTAIGAAKAEQSRKMAAQK